MKPHDRRRGSQTLESARIVMKLLDRLQWSLNHELEIEYRHGSESLDPGRDIQHLAKHHLLSAENRAVAFLGRHLTGFVRQIERACRVSQELDASSTKWLIYLHRAGAMNLVSFYTKTFVITWSSWFLAPLFDGPLFGSLVILGLAAPCMVGLSLLGKHKDLFWDKLTNVKRLNIASVAWMVAIMPLVILSSISI